MSWNTTVGPVPYNELLDAIKVAKIDIATQGPDTPERDEQLSTAITAALVLAHSGAVGTEGTYKVTLAGHANPDHKPNAGWAGDSLYVQVFRIDGGV